MPSSAAFTTASSTAQLGDGNRSGSASGQSCPPPVAQGTVSDLRACRIAFVPARFFSQSLFHELEKARIVRLPSLLDVPKTRTLDFFLVGMQAKPVSRRRIRIPGTSGQQSNGPSLDIVAVFTVRHVQP